MDIIDYTTIARRRLRLLVGVPLVVALIVLGVTFLSAPEFKSTATVGATTLVGGPENSFNGPQGPNQFTAAFAAMAGMPEVARKVSDSTGWFPYLEQILEVRILFAMAQQDLDLSKTNWLLLKTE